MKRILITGGAGSVGRELTHTLLEHGYGVRVFDLPVVNYGELEALANVEIVRGDITNAQTVHAAVAGVDIVLHLAALMPPASEKNRERTFAINVEGTRLLVEGIQRAGTQARLIFTSSVATYGNTTEDEPPIRLDHAQRPIDIYGESKVASEQILFSSKVPYTVLRVSAISVPALLDPPEQWPFMRNQRMEFVYRGDVIQALVASVLRSSESTNKVFHIAGGPSWRMRGHEYATAYCRVLDVPANEEAYRDAPGWCDWYDTTESQAILGYQQTPFSRFIELFQQVVEAALA